MNAQTIIRNMDKLKSERSELNTMLEEVSAFACPEKTGLFFQTDRPEGRDKPASILTDCVSEANSILARGLYSNLCPPGVKFFQYSPLDPEQKKNQNLKRAFAAASDTVFQLISSSNFASELSEAFEDFGWAGIVNLAIEPDSRRVFRFHNYHISDYYCGESGDKTIDQVYREFRLTARQIVQMYSAPDDELPPEIVENGRSELLEKSEKKYTLIHAVYLNPEVRYDAHGEAMLDKGNKKWKSVTVCREKTAIIRDSGFDRNPYTVARFEKKAHSVYGYSPGLRVRRTAKVLNRALTSVIRGTHLQVEPPVILDTAGYKEDMAPLFFNHPGAVNYYDSANGTSRPPQFMPTPTNLQAGMAMVEKFEAVINQAYFVNLFQLLQQLAETTNQERTKFEVMQLVSEKHTLIIPIVARILEELLQPLILKAFYLALEAGALEDAGELLESGVEVTFDSPLALAAKRSKVSLLFDALSQVVQYAQFDGGQSLDYINFDRVTQSVLESGSVSPEFVRPDSEVEVIRTKRAEQQQAQLAAQQMSELAKSQNLNVKPESGSIAGSAIEALARG